MTSKTLRISGVLTFLAQMELILISPFSLVLYWQGAHMPHTIAEWMDVSQIVPLYELQFALLTAVLFSFVHLSWNVILLAWIFPEEIYLGEQLDESLRSAKQFWAKRSWGYSALVIAGLLVLSYAGPWSWGWALICGALALQTYRYRTYMGVISGVAIKTAPS